MEQIRDELGSLDKKLHGCLGIDLCCFALPKCVGGEPVCEASNNMHVYSQLQMISAKHFGDISYSLNFYCARV